MLYIKVTSIPPRKLPQNCNSTWKVLVGTELKEQKGICISKESDNRINEINIELENDIKEINARFNNSLSGPTSAETSLPSPNVNFRALEAISNQVSISIFVSYS